MLVNGKKGVNLEVMILVHKTWNVQGSRPYVWAITVVKYMASID